MTDNTDTKTPVKGDTKTEPRAGTGPICGGGDVATPSANPTKKEV